MRHNIEINWISFYLPEWQKTFYYLTLCIILEGYNDALDILTQNLRNMEELIEVAAVETMSRLIEIFYSI